MSETSSEFQSTVRRHIGGFTQTNGYAFSTPEGWIGVDAPIDFHEWLSEQKIRLKALLLTHAHFDHVHDAAIIARDHQCPVYAWEISTPATRLEIYLLQMAGMNLQIDEYPVDFILEGKSSIQVGGIDLKLAHVPGHSSDSVVFIDHQNERVFSGDTLMDGTMGRTDFPGGGTKMLIENIRTQLLPLGNQFKVYSGHGEVTTIGAERDWISQMRI